jgi:hypothetical protein
MIWNFYGTSIEPPCHPTHMHQPRQRRFPSVSSPKSSPRRYYRPLRRQTEEGSTCSPPQNQRPHKHKRRRPRRCGRQIGGHIIRLPTTTSNTRGRHKGDNPTPSSLGNVHRETACTFYALGLWTPTRHPPTTLVDHTRGGPPQKCMRLRTHPTNPD